MQKILWEGDTPYEHYQVVDTIYDGRQARVLYSGNQQAAQSGIAKDGKPDLLFDYNQRLQELAIGLEPKRILVIGGGVFTLPVALLHVLPEVHVDVVEVDPGLMEIARRFFTLPTDDRLAIFNADGRSYLREHSARYDLIIVDVYVNIAIPRDIKTVQAFEAYREHLTNDGAVAMNVISGYYGPSAEALHEVYAAATCTFDTIDILLASRGYSLWLPQNFVLTAQKGRGLSLRDYVRHDAVELPEICLEAALDD